MSESEILQGLFSSINAVMTLFSMFFTMVSAYIAALYFFLNRAPFALKLLAFALLSIGLVFLGGSAATIQRILDGLYGAWAKLPQPILSIDDLRNPIALPSLPGLSRVGVSMQEIGVAIGWITAGSVYLALGYLTFLHRWAFSGDGEG